MKSLIKSTFQLIRERALSNARAALLDSALRENTALHRAAMLQRRVDRLQHGLATTQCDTVRNVLAGALEGAMFDLERAQQHLEMLQHNREVSNNVFDIAG